MSERWRISLFGGLEATRGECRIVRFPTRHAAALLAFLALHLHRSHPRAPLAALLWPDAQETTARHRLSQALTSLRALLCLPPTPLLLSGRDRVQLNPDAVSIDVQAFTTALQLARRAPHDPERVQALDRALDLYSAPLLPERTEEWLIPEREAFAEQYFLALQEAAGLLDKLGEPEAAIARLRRGVAIDPLREEAQRALIGLLLETGQRDGAWRQYRSFEQALARELGAEPSAPTQALVAAIRSRPAPAAAAAPRDTEGTETERRAGRPPAPRTRFFGREAEIATLLSWLGGESGERLVTLTGAGGSGKTRLALEVARRLGKEAGTRVVWTHLADLVEAGQIPGAIRDALGLAPEPGRGALEHVIVHLERHPAVLVLDNYEHLVEEGACVVARLLGEAESVRCLVTSRQRLDLSGERECPVAPLPAPEAPPAPAAALASRLSAGEDLAVSREASAESLLAYASVALFMDRARGVRPDFALTPANVAAVGAICARLEGLPLAIELAAARVRLLTPEELLGRLERQLEVLTGGPRDAPGRQRTLRATIAWSYGLLEQEERPLFRRLGVFAGGWTLAAAERVCGAEGLLDHLAGLVERSLVEVVDGSGVTRYRMLEMIREFALERLAESGEKAAVRERHAAAYLAIAEDAREQAEAGAGGDWRKRVAPEEGNLRAALDWSEEQHQIERALRLATLLSCVLTARGRQEEAQERLSRLLARVDASVDRTVHARALTEATEVARARGDARAARAFGRERRWRCAPSA
jgi:predicted ATPase/DNA-binding SARP family transcriptional activator